MENRRQTKIVTAKFRAIIFAFTQSLVERRRGYLFLFKKNLNCAIKHDVNPIRQKISTLQIGQWNKPLVAFFFTLPHFLSYVRLHVRRSLKVDKINTID